jgi:hypothetical protein
MMVIPETHRAHLIRYIHRTFFIKNWTKLSELNSDNFILFLYLNTVTVTAGTFEP